MRLLFLGDMVGRSGRTAVYEKLPGLISDLKLDFVIVNGENAAGGFGITEEIFHDTIRAGADVVTTGNHVWDQREALDFSKREDRFLRPANFPKGTAGKGEGLFIAKNGARVLVSNVMGRVFMHPDLDDPFIAAEKILEACPLGEQADAVFFDFHAEATSEKQCFGHFVDGRASAVVGTHTHVPTADCQILRNGTAYMSDAGMCGDYDSSLGMDKEEPLNRFLSKVPKGRFEAASGPATICGVGIEISDRTGLAEKVAPLRIGARLEEAIPEFWK
ncbi:MULTISPECIES: TIGR00282 family metallophosphoesterase [Ochrobactrum]|jgi:metallophosphoesterase (TIGR00282 family)|uniref:TIGR00282 family metallophosphoesterase n=1 Tax=Ochrobactrum quorumnocens TaxID=271865 RepID=A0A248UIC9_9HYPH|nr:MULTISPECIES: TIGR00282 family metallophosphoesterase [Brucella/Ochrobactrum group]MBD7991652.1 TIGR00282 family metallophosphoesterase [Ochrobactrum gallinarum]ASV86362.1 ymdB-like family protein [[Ochrobactrum] quorumnocens]KAA9361763.1 TIGR00282 family metallophosphoesterase [[Ochrobactrum] quorumnocens]MCV9909805.1 TIGR00282 family metallophosphoesterase [Brucella sp. HL-2]MDH7792745.1 metallophosphoesterase (TIGR00282 family) [Ochrobactrum sp. AN78]